MIRPMLTVIATVLATILLLSGTTFAEPQKQMDWEGDLIVGTFSNASGTGGSYSILSAGPTFTYRNKALEDNGGPLAVREFRQHPNQLTMTAKVNRSARDSKVNDYTDRVGYGVTLGTGFKFYSQSIKRATGFGMYMESSRAFGTETLPTTGKEVDAHVRVTSFKVSFEHYLSQNMRMGFYMDTRKQQYTHWQSLVTSKTNALNLSGIFRKYWLSGSLIFGKSLSEGQLIDASGNLYGTEMEFGYFPDSYRFMGLTLSTILNKLDDFNDKTRDLSAGVFYQFYPEKSRSLKASVEYTNSQAKSNNVVVYENKQFRITGNYVRTF